MSVEMLDERGTVWALVAEVVDAVELEIDVVAAGIADRVVARMQATNAELAATLHDALQRGISAGVRDALARLRSQTELPQELLPDLKELARLYAASGCERSGIADAWLVAQEVFWDRFEVVTERTLADTALCWDNKGRPGAPQGLRGASERPVPQRVYARAGPPHGHRRALPSPRRLARARRRVGRPR
jgi:hypothetical protein